RAGQRQAALDQYEACRRALREELAVDPQPETTALFNRLRAAVQRPPHNLPARTTAFIGRQFELGLVSNLLSNTDCRQATITGLGGSGKSRLAVEVGRELAVADQHMAEQPFPDGVLFVSLAELAAPSDASGSTHQRSIEAIFAAIARTLELPPSTALTSRDQVLEYVHSKQMLLILDNLEHLLAGRAAVADLLSHAPHVKVVATSRAPLHISAERVLPMDGLKLPADEDELESAAASALFLAEARRVELGYQVSREDRPALVELCRVLGGLPLALILAARWAPVLSCRQMLGELSSGLDMLATDELDLPERQRSLACVLESTLEGLQSSDRALTRELALQPDSGGARHRGAPLDYLARARSLREQALVSFDSARGSLQLHPLLRRYVVPETCSRRTPGRGDAIGMVVASIA
ncbi:MAG: AAA family ATPase, partial [Chloroflexi bacterium]|nr:AAA family ATPase [Chloroflexota bacterium]